MGGPEVEMMRALSSGPIGVQGWDELGKAEASVSMRLLWCCNSCSRSCTWRRSCLACSLPPSCEEDEELRCSRRSFSTRLDSTAEE